MASHSAPGIKDLRQFGFIIAGGLGVIWLLHGLSRGSFANSLLYFAGAFLVLGLITPRILFWPYRVWMWIGGKMGFVMNRVILTIVYAIVITPFAVIRRLFTKDPFRLRYTQDATYFEAKSVQPPEKERLMY